MRDDLAARHERSRISLRSIRATTLVERGRAFAAELDDPMTTNDRHWRNGHAPTSAWMA